MGGDVYSFKQLKEQKLASPLQAPAAGKHKAPSMIDLLGKVEHTLILAHAHEPFQLTKSRPFGKGVPFDG